jgi:NADH:ubiquinone oxidoreductase subunit C
MQAIGEVIDLQEYKRIDIQKDQIVPVAERMRREGRYLVMIHAFINKDGQMVFSYEYAVDPAIESYHVVGETTLPSIAMIYDVAAEWPERELNELFGIEFEGLDTSKRLFLPEDMLDPEGRGQIMVTPLSELVEKNRKEGTV